MSTPPSNEVIKPGRPAGGLRERLVVVLLVPLICIMLISAWFDFQVARQTTDSAHDQALADAVFDIEGHLRERPVGEVLDMAEESEAMLRSNEPDKVYFSIRDAEGRQLAGDGDLPRVSRSSDGRMMFYDGTYLGQPVRIAVHSVATARGDLVVTVVGTTEKRRQSRERVMTAMILPNLAVIFATLLAVVFGVRRGLLPLEAVEAEIAARSPNDLREIDPDRAPREIRPTLRRLNALFSTLREASAAQNRFIADAAHQMRTPLAALQSQLDLAAAEGALAQDGERLKNIESGMQRLGRLLGQLLSYARAESSAPMGSPPETVALDLIAEKSASTFIDAAVAKNIDLGFELLPARLQGTAWLLQEALANLIDNAIRYCPAGSCITVRSGQAESAVFLEVDDNGPGIGQEFMPHVFERFYRVPGSEGNGCGLGLPIVKEIVEFHGGRVHVLAGPGQGLRVRMEFPA